MRTHFLIAILLSCLLNITSASAMSQDVLLDNQIQSTINTERVKYRLPALSVSIKLPEETVAREYVSGYYTLEEKKKITQNTLFQIGSITKTFTATIIFKLIEKHKVKLSDHLTQWLPQYSRWQDITIADLLKHTSGVYNYTQGKNFDDLLKQNPEKIWSLHELADIAYHHTDIAKPGQKYEYTNTDYVLLGMIIEKITHQFLQHIFDEYFNKYHLYNTYYLPSGYPDNVKNRIAHGYNQDGLFRFNTDVAAINMSFSPSSGAMITTPSDIIHWLNLLFEGKIMTRQSLVKMMTIISETDAKPINLQTLDFRNQLFKKDLLTEVGVGAGMGLVYFRNNGFNWVHAGGMPGYESFYAFNPCNGTYLVLMYNVKPKQQLIFIKIAESLFKGLNNSELVSDHIKRYQQKNLLPQYCKRN